DSKEYEAAAQNEIAEAGTAGPYSESATAAGAGPHTLSVPLPRGAWQSGSVDVTYTLTQGGDELLRSAIIAQPLSASSAELALSAVAAGARLFVNGHRVPVGAEPVAVELGEGLNIIAVEARAQGNAPGVTVAITSLGHEIGPGWVCRADAPGEDWMTELPGEGWAAPRIAGGRMWPAGGGARAWFSRALYVGEARPQLFPKLDVFYIPRGSRQLMRLYLHAPREAPSDDYAMVVEAPAALKFVAAEPVSGGTPVVSKGDVVEVAGRRLRRWAVAYDMIPYQGMEISLRWGDINNTSIGYQPSIRAGGTFDWRHLSMEVTAPENAASVHPLIIKWQNRGIVGTFWVDNVAFHEVGGDRNLLKMGTFDEPGWKLDNHRIFQEGVDGSRCCKIVSTPENADKQQALWVDPKETVPVEPGKKYVIEADVRCEGVGSPSARPLVGLLFEGPVGMAEGEYPLYTYFTARSGLVTELPHRSRVVVLPPLKNKRPRHARITPCYYSSRFSNDEVGRAYAENCWASGITWSYGRSDNNVVPHLLPRGHRVILSLGWAPWQAVGSSMEMLKDRPELQAMDFKGRRIKYKFCPTWMLSDDPEALAARAELEKWVLGWIATGDYYGVDWDLEEPVVDPPTYCTCERCLAAFRREAGIAADVKLTPDMLLAEYRDAWVDFRCRQNARVTGMLRDMIRKFERPLEFSLYSGYQCQRTKEHYGVDWTMMAPYIDHGIAGYGGNRKLIHATVEALGDVPFMGGEMWYLSHNSDARPAPRMETWRNRLLRQYVESGCHGVLIWQLASMDGGAFYATSEAAAIIADNEDWFTQGRRCDERVQVEGLEPQNWAAFEKDGRTLVLLMSFEKEPVTATVTLDGRTERRVLDPYGTAVVIM
ncbi:MAG: hypothetical protein J7M38_05565, partial [Armatimonadetes bacterium]|nr:hypothetical protein [Armatimonadota bacterium]